MCGKVGAGTMLPMVEDAGVATPSEGPNLDSICPWCSASLPAADAAVCPSCGARLVEASDVEIPGVTAVDPAVLAAAAAPRKIKRTFGSLLVGKDDEIPPPSEAEMPALARPDADVRREMLRLEMDARLSSLKAEVASLNAEDAVAMARDASPGSPATGPATEPPPETDPAVGESTAPETGEPPGRD